MGIFNVEQASESARKEAKSDVIVTSSPERVPDRSPGPFLCALMGGVLPLETLASTFRFERSRVILDARAGEPENLKGGSGPSVAIGCSLRLVARVCSAVYLSGRSSLRQLNTA